MKNLIDYFNSIEKNKISHAYIISNTKLKYIEKELQEIISKYFFEKDIDIYNNADIKVLKAYDNFISKDDIKELLSNVSLTSQFNNKKIYIIDGCELLSDYSYNAILKTLEEPSENVYAFLITNNINNVKDTIISRCQKIFISSEKLEFYDDKIIDISNKILNHIENSLANKCLYNELYNEITNLNQLSNIIEYLINIYFKKINDLEDSNDIIIFSKRLIVLNNLLNLTKSNLNKNLTIDRLLIEMWRCKNENC